MLVAENPVSKPLNWGGYTSPSNPKETMTKQNLDFRSTDGLLEVLEEAVKMGTNDPSKMDLARLQISGCKHAIQIYAILSQLAPKDFSHGKLPNVELQSRQKKLPKE